VTTTTQTRPRKEELPALTAVSRRAGKAIIDFGMIQEGDRIAVAVSGGKDSLSLLHVLRDRRRVSPVKFDFTAVHIDFEFSDFNPQVLVEYLEKEGFPYLVEKADSLKDEKYETIDCFRWSWNRRKAIFQAAAREGFNKIAFGHHLDDIVETILLNQFYRGEISAMKPRQELFGGKVVIIRPLTYVREEAMACLARELGIDSMGQSKCANDDTSHRVLIKQMLKQFEKDNPSVAVNIFKSLQNVKTEYLIETVPSPSHPSPRHT
jgi:tRNA 2-thiocytidine biosynthesis protein TtcA